jgi:hypothetical protein
MILQIADDLFLVSVIDEEDLAPIRRQFDDTSQDFPEFLDGATLYVLGAFGAYGNPASFHNPLVRILRKIVHPRALKAIRRVTEDGVNVHQLFDRMCLRKAGTAYQGESWHRDVVTGLASLPSDKIWGGWLNLGPSQQSFRCVPGSAMAVGAGFARAEEPPADQQRTIWIRPGQMILFRQDILHAVTSVKYPEDSYRLFVGFRTTISMDPLYDVMGIVHDMTSPPLPSGQMPPMFSAMHDSALLHRITIPWSDNSIRPEFKQPRNVRGEIKSVVPRFIRRGVDVYPEYTHDDISIMMPRPL